MRWIQIMLKYWQHPWNGSSLSRTSFSLKLLPFSPPNQLHSLLLNRLNWWWINSLFFVPVDSCFSESWKICINFFFHLTANAENLLFMTSSSSLSSKLSPTQFILNYRGLSSSCLILQDFRLLLSQIQTFQFHFSTKCNH